MLLITTKATVILGEPHYKPCIQFNGQEWVHTQSFKDEEIAYQHALNLAVRVNAMVRNEMKDNRFELVT